MSTIYDKDEIISTKLTNLDVIIIVEMTDTLEYFMLNQEI